MKYTCIACQRYFDRWPKKGADFMPKYCSLECESRARTIIKRDQLVGLLNSGLTITAAAVRIGVSQSAVSNAVKRYHIKRKTVAS
jgi:seryl-tRNA(Sec) selenium transferase